MLQNAAEPLAHTAGAVTTTPSPALGTRAALCIEETLAEPVPVARLRLAVSPSAVAWTLAAAALTLSSASAAGQFVAKAIFGRDNVFGLVPAFNLGMEANIPTWFASSLLLLVAALIAYVARDARARGLAGTRHWWGLAVIFLLLSIDETASFHELLNKPFRSLLGASGAFHYTWVVPMAAFVAVVALSYLPFLWKLPRETSRRFVLAGVTYVGGALGMELVGGYLFTERTGQSLLLALSVTVEETMEMLGLILMIYALLQHIVRATAADVTRASTAEEVRAGA